MANGHMQIWKSYVFLTLAHQVLFMSNHIELVARNIGYWLTGCLVDNKKKENGSKYKENTSKQKLKIRMLCYVKWSFLNRY